MKFILMIKKLYSKYIGSKLFNKVIVIWLVIFVLLASLLSTGYYITVKSSINDSYVNNTKNLLHIAANDFSSYINQISEVSLSLRGNEDLIYKIMDNAHLFEIDDELRLANYLRYKNMGIIKMEYYCPSTNANYEIIGEGISQKTSFLTNEDWYKKLLMSDRYYYIETQHNSEDSLYEKDKYAIVFHRNILDIPVKEPALIVSIYIDTEIFESMMDLSRTDEDDIIFLFDGNDQMYYVSSGIDKELLQSDEFFGLKDKEHIELNDVNYQIASNSSDNQDWYLVKLAKEDLLIDELSSMFFWGLFVILVFLTALFLMFLLLIKKIRGNIAKLISQINKVGKGDFNNQIAVTSDDEIGQLSDEFNKMTRRIKRLIDRNYKLKIREKDAMLRVLESQINPHFLYNTIQAISGLAIENRQMKIADMLKELSASFRYKISNQVSTTVYDEIEYMRTYIKLCKLRFGNRINVEYDVDIDTLDIIIPKMMFQYLVENTIKHAMEKTMNDVLIELSVKKNNHIIEISYRDNGVGVRENELDRIINNIKHSGSGGGESDSGIGLANIYQRLILGEHSLISFDIESVYKKYFSVQIKMMENSSDV